MRNASRITITLVLVVMLCAILAFTLYNNNPIEISKSLQTNIQTPTTQLNKPTQTPLPTPNLITQLGINEVPSHTGFVPRAYTRLYIQGTVTNTGAATAYKAGLHVAAYAADGTLEINMTVPLIGGELATDAVLTAYAASYDPPYPLGLLHNYSNLTFSNLAGGEGTIVDLNIYHRGTVTRWSITSVYT